MTLCAFRFYAPLLSKLKDLGSSIIPYFIGKLAIGKALYDLEANVSLMPLFLCRKLNIHKPKPLSL